MKDEGSLSTTGIPDSSNFRRLSKAIEGNDPVTTELLALAYLFESESISSGHFGCVMQMVFDLGKMSASWKAAFELAYESQPLNRRILYRSSMTTLYLWFKDYHMAERFLAAKPELPNELAESMEVYLQLKRYDDAKAVAETCARKMACRQDPQSLRILSKTLRRYRRAMENPDLDESQVRVRLLHNLGRWRTELRAALGSRAFLSIEDLAENAPFRVLQLVRNLITSFEGQQREQEAKETAKERWKEVRDQTT